MQSNKIPRIIQWWVTPKLPYHDIFEFPTLQDKSFWGEVTFLFSQWFIHPIKRRLARHYLKLLQKYSAITVIGVTGSAGKSTTVQMLAAILKNLGSTVATPPSIDPVYNIPNTILSAKPGTKYLILEMSIEYPGEMDYYLWLAQPKIGVITNIYPTHTQFLGNEAGVAKEKAKLIYSLKQGGYAILNRENRHSKDIVRKTKARVIWFGKDGSVFANNIIQNGLSGTKFTLKINKNKISVHLPIIGSQYVGNALAAASLGHILGASLAEIENGLEEFKVPDHRMKPIKLASGAVIIDDTYNNNPVAAKEALNVLDSIDAEKKVVVMGDMLELGNLEEKYHKEIGSIIGKMKVFYLIGVGQASKILVEEAAKELGNDKTHWVSSEDKVLDVLTPLLKRDIIILIKGSRSIGLDKLVNRLYNEKC